MVSDSIPKNSFGWEYKRRSSLCTHAFHCTDSKDPDIHFLDRWMLKTKTHPACTIYEDGMWLPQWFGFKNSHVHKNLTQNGGAKRSSWGRQNKKNMCSSSTIALRKALLQTTMSQQFLLGYPWGSMNVSLKWKQIISDLLRWSVIHFISPFFIALVDPCCDDLGPVPWRSMTVKWWQSSQSSRHSTIGTASLA